jgi:hypothetical protein
MRSRWDFHFDCKGIQFQCAERFDVQITEKDAKDFGLPARAFNALIDIEPDEKSRNPLVEQTGKMKITLPGTSEVTKDLVFWLAHHVAKQITFSQREMKIHYGLVLGEQLPDTPEEGEELGDKTWFGEAHLVQYPPTPPFDGSFLNKVSSNALVNQFTADDRAVNPIDAFLASLRFWKTCMGQRRGRGTSPSH